jgi:hypothetical protein
MMQKRRAILVTGCLIALASAQTLPVGTAVDLRTQSKSVNFTAENATSPFQAGTSLPATCAVGQAFFQTNAAAGLNLYGCTAVNSWTLFSAGILLGDVTGTPSASTVSQIQGRPVAATAPTGGQSLAWSSSANSWTPQTMLGRIQNSGTALPVEPSLNFAGGGCTDDPTNSRTDCTGTGGGGIAGVTIDLNGTAQGTQAALNFISGTGIIQSCVNNTGASRVDCTPSYNSALIPTHDTIHANESYCASSNGTTAYTCSMPDKALISYSTGQVFLLNVDTTCATSCTLNVDGNGIKTITQPNGSTAPTGALVAGQAQLIWYDGTVMRLMY